MDAVENRGLYRVFVSQLFARGFRPYCTTIAWLSLLSGLGCGGLVILPDSEGGCEIERDSLPIALAIAEEVL